jgi:glucose/arabinose dehydrogenase
MTANCSGPMLVAVQVATGLNHPVYMAAPWGDTRLFVVEQAGKIRAVDPVNQTVLGTFLDIQTRVGSAGDQGLWSVAFPPDYADSGHFYVLYQAPNGDGVVSRFVADDPAGNFADPLSEMVLLRVPMGGVRDLGGALQFGPADGMLYVGIGDGGVTLDAQSLSSLRGKMLRLDVSGGPRDAYRVPGDNPFAGASPPTRREIWALGLHDPYRADFDIATGELWIADRGRIRAEELDVEAAGDGGRNYGWPIHEGTICLRSRPDLGLPCESPTAPVRFTFPVYDYNHAEACSIIGGVPYRGGATWAHGHYMFADQCNDHVMIHAPLALGGGWVADVTQRVTSAGASFLRIEALSHDGYGEAHIVSRDNGRVYRVQPGYDSDQDGVMDPADNCPFVSNRDQLDSDGTGPGDACDME